LLGRLNLTEAGIYVLPSGKGADGFLDNRPSPEAVRIAAEFLARDRKEIDEVIAEEYGIVPAVTTAAVRDGHSSMSNRMKRRLQGRRWNCCWGGLRGRDTRRTII